MGEKDLIDGLWQNHLSPFFEIVQGEEKLLYQF